MASVSVVNPRADVLRKVAALSANCNAARGLSNILRSNLGPRGTLKMLIGGAGQIKLTKDGNVLLHEMQIQHPTASMIARVSTAQDSMTGDGTTSTVLLIGELMRQSERYLFEGVHPRHLCDGIELAREELLSNFILKHCTVSRPDPLADSEFLTCVAKTSLRTKLPGAEGSQFVNSLSETVVEAVKCIAPSEKGKPIDLFMIELLHQKKQLMSDTRLIKGMVMDHGGRHPGMPSRLEDCYVLVCNVSLEYEKTEVNSGFFYSDSKQREKLVLAERRFCDEKVNKVIALKQKLCTSENKKTFVVFNQKGIDPPSLDMLARERILALRRVKRRNMERLTLCCGGNALNSFHDLSEADLGHAGLVYEEVMGDEKYTFVEQVKSDAKACAILVKGPNDHSINQVKDAIRDGLRAVRNAVEDLKIVPGAGAFEVASYVHLMDFAKNKVSGKQKFGVYAMAEALLSIPKTLAENSGLDAQDCVLRLVEERQKSPQTLIGLDLTTGKPILPESHGIWDNYRVKRQMLALAPALAQQLLLVDEIIKAGKQMNRS